MPLVHRPGGVIPPDGGRIIFAPDPAILFRPWAYSYIGPDGSVWPFVSSKVVAESSDNALLAVRGGSGLDGAPVDLKVVDLADGGVRPDDARDQAGVIAWPLQVRHREQAKFNDKRRRFLKALRNKINGVLVPGEFRATDADGVTRSVQVYTRVRPEGSTAPSGSGPRWAAYEVEWLYADPAWYGDPLPLSVPVTPPPAFFPFPPLQLAAAPIAGQIVVNVEGDAPAYPVWDFVGPALPGLTAENQTTGQLWELELGGLGTGESLHIDSHPARQTAVYGDGSSAWADMSFDSVLWELEPGVENVIAVAVTGTAAATSMTGFYRPRWNSA